jgi:plasmid maintenance system antidote protein VapI
MKLNRIILKILKTLDISQNVLAKKLGVSQATISFWVNNKIHLSYKNYIKLRKFCDKNGIDDKIEDRFQ